MWQMIYVLIQLFALGSGIAIALIVLPYTFLAFVALVALWAIITLILNFLGIKLPS